MIKILFVCHGNICRSPMAEYVFKDLVDRKGLSDQFEIASAATSREELGNPMDFRTQQVLRAHGVPFGPHAARQADGGDYERYDLLLCMEEKNRRALLQRLGGDPQHKVSLLLAFAQKTKNIDDPWYTGNFEKAFEEIQGGCQNLLQYLLSEK